MFSIAPSADVFARATPISANRRTIGGSVGTQIITAAISAGQRLLDAVGAVPRIDFVPQEERDRAYLDVPVRIPHDQVTTQPSLVARMIEALALSGDERVLEVGTGYGWQTALLARLAAAVWSVERRPDLAGTARENLARQRITNATVVVGDGSEGLGAHAPFDAILVSAAEGKLSSVTRSTHSHSNSSYRGL